jgi:hypothetical protein
MTTPTPPPVTPPAAGAPPAPGQSPQPDPGQSATDAAGMDEVAWQIAAEADAQFSVVAEPGGGGPQIAAQVPQQQAPAPPAQTTG